MFVQPRSTSLLRAAVLSVLAAIAMALAANSAALASPSACATIHMTGAAILAKASKLVGPGTIAESSKNDCDLFSSRGGNIEAYVWPKSQEQSALAEILDGTFAGRPVSKTHLTGLGAGATAYAGDPMFVAGNYFVALIEPMGVSRPHILGVARLIYHAMT